MFQTHEALRMLANLDPPQLAKWLRHVRSAAADALDGRGGKEACDRFRLDDLVPIADALSFLAEEVDWSRLRELDPEAWARNQGGDR